jgi:hypothetical protein
MSNVYKSLQLSHLGTEKECHLVIPTLIKCARQRSNLKLQIQSLVIWL